VLYGFTTNKSDQAVKFHGYKAPRLLYMLDEAPGIPAGDPPGHRGRRSQWERKHGNDVFDVRSARRRRRRPSMSQGAQTVGNLMENFNNPET
jgi:hypothetical protein